MSRSPESNRGSDRYYRTALSGERLRRCYEIAPPRVRQYLDAELSHTADLISGASRVLELGCGYGRALEYISSHCDSVVGVDNSWDSLSLARTYLGRIHNCHLACADAGRTGLHSGAFDAVICIQNGISAFHMHLDQLVSEAVRLIRPGRQSRANGTGLAIFSTYAAQFWPDRLEWFVRQSEEGLIGAIDWSATRDGQIRCKDGFTATTFTPEQFGALAARFGLNARVEVVDESSVFWVVEVHPQ